MEFGTRVVFEIGGIPVTETVTVTWFIMAVLTFAAIVLTKNLKNRPSRVQIVTEAIVGGIRDLTISTMGEENEKFTPFVGTLLLYLAIANTVGVFGLRPPTADANTTLSLAILVFVIIHTFGCKSNGVKKYLKGFTEPFFLMTPMNLIGELAFPISLGFRLFGNILGGFIIMSLLYAALGSFTDSLLGLSIPLLQIGLPAFLHMYFDLFAGLLQSFIFVMLSMVFISMAMD